MTRSGQGASGARRLSWAIAVLVACALVACGGMAAAGRLAGRAGKTSAASDAASRTPRATPRPRPGGSASPAPKPTPSPSAGAGTGGARASQAPPASATPSPTASPEDPGVSRTLPVSSMPPQVGAVFTGGLDGDHYCTASVVDSPGQDLIVTAAHCLDSTSQVFVPDYHDGVAPYGVWQLERIVVDAQWSADSDEDHDLAFAVVAPRNGRTVQSVVGGYTLGIGGTANAEVTVTGYPETADTPITCTNGISAYGDSQLRIQCSGFTGGTSGSPWVTGTGAGRQGPGTVIGVIGGHEEGGDTPDVSYSVVFGPGVQALYDRAVSYGSSADPSPSATEPAAGKP